MKGSYVLKLTTNTKHQDSYEEAEGFRGQFANGRRGAKTVVDALFLMHPTRVDQEDDINVDDIPEFMKKSCSLPWTSLEIRKLPAQTAYQPRL